MCGDPGKNGKVIPPYRTTASSLLITRYKTGK